jgi:hypothetical protein
MEVPMSRGSIAGVFGTTALLTLIACNHDPVDPSSATGGLSASVNAASPPPPAGVVPISFLGRSLSLYPFTANDLEGAPADPINLIFTGNVDVLSLRAALLELDGDRQSYGLPGTFPFNCRWTDASGGIQTAYTDGDGWVANPVQLQCGGYDPIRFHLRLFPAGDWVVAGVHMDLLIPGTPEHQVISWELARQLVLIDFLRGNRLDPADPIGGTQLITPAPSYRDIPAVIYDGIPTALKVAIGGPPSSGGNPVPLPNTGAAAILNISSKARVADGGTSSDFTLPFDQLIPRPFCATGPADYVKVNGRVRIVTRTDVVSGTLSSHNTLDGDITVTPFDVQTGVSGEPFRARIDQNHITGVGPAGAHVNAIELLLGIPPAGERHGSLRTQLQTSSNGVAHFTRQERC